MQLFRLPHNALYRTFTTTDERSKGNTGRVSELNLMQFSSSSSALQQCFHLKTVLEVRLPAEGLQHVCVTQLMIGRRVQRCRDSSCPTMFR